MSKKPEDPKPAAKVEDTQIVAKAEGQKAEAMTAERLNAEYPDLFKAIVAEAVQAERNRIKSLSEIDNGANHELIVKAMFEEPMTAEQVAIETIKMQKEQKLSKTSSIAADAQALANDLEGVQPSEGALPQDKDAESRAQLVAAVHAQLAKINGYKK